MARLIQSFAAKEMKLMHDYAAEDEVNAPLCVANDTVLSVHLCVVGWAIDTQVLAYMRLISWRSDIYARQGWHISLGFTHRLETCTPGVTT